MEKESSMPYIIDITKKCKKIHTMKLEPFGWIGPQEIEFGTALINLHDPQPSICMRVIGAKHVWANFIQNVNFESKGNYAEYFKKILEEFRLDLLTWIHTPVYQNLSWVKEYYDMFKGKIYDFSKSEQEKFEKIYKEGTPDNKR